MKEVREIAENVKRLRERADISQVELAAKAGITASAISMIEAGLRSPSLVISCKISEALEVSVTELTGEDNRSEPDEQEFKYLLRQLGSFNALSKSDKEIIRGMIKLVKDKNSGS